MTHSRPDTLTLWNLAEGRPLKEFPLPRVAVSSFTHLVTALAADGSRVAAGWRRSDGISETVAWDARSGKELCRLSEEAAALAFTPDGTRLGIGSPVGRINVWTLATGAPSACPFIMGSGRVTCLAFQRSVVAHLHGPAGAASWRLAAGDADARIMIWDVESQATVSQCAGSFYSVNALAFSPDGTLLAGGGRTRIQLWDVATGNYVLDLDYDDYVTVQTRKKPKPHALKAIHDGCRLRQLGPYQRPQFDRHFEW